MFDNLIESKAKKQKRAGGTIFSAVFHGIVITAGVMGTLHAKEELEKPKAEKVDFVQVKKDEPPPPKEEVKPPPPEEAAEQELTWIEIVLLDSDDQPVAGEKYRITLPDGSVAEGTTDNDGKAKVEQIKPGTCQVTFPGLPGQAWE